MCGKSVAFWYYVLPLITSSLMFWPISTSDNREENYSTVQYQFGVNTMRNYDNEEDLIRYNLHENSTIDNDVMQYEHHINFTSNNSKNEDLIQYKFQPHVAKKHENDSQTSVQFRINSKKTSGKKNFMSREIHENLKGIKDENDSTSYNFFKNFDRYNIVPDKICNNITCIRLCCPFGNRLVNGKCIAQQGEFIFLQNMYGYINNSLQNKSKRVNELFLLIVDDPCQKTGYYLLDSYQNTFLVNGSLYLPYYNTIVESTSYCLAAVNHNIFAVNVCFDIMKEIMDKTINHNKNIIYQEFINEDWMYIKDNSNRNNNKNNILDKMYDNIIYIRLCCPFGNHLIKGKCIAGQGNFVFLKNVYGYVNNSLRNESKSVDKLFLLIVNDPCQKTGHYFFYPTQENVLLDDGSWYLHKTKDAYHNVIIKSTSYCLAVVNSSDSSVPRYEFTVNVCHDIASKFIKRVDTPINQDDSISTDTIVSMCGFLGSLLFSLVIFIVYSIVPELRNIHGFILCGYSSSIVIVNTVELLKVVNKRADIDDSICIVYAFVKYYFLLTSWFWLSVMSIDMWRTFRHSLQKEVKQQERKKLILYSAYGWGGPFMLAIIYGIMDFVPGVSENFQPKFDKDCCFDSYMTRMLFVHGIITICIISIIYLCINTSRKIEHYETNIDNNQRNLETRRYKDNKQWFNLYLKTTKILFIIFCIKLPMNMLSCEVSCSFKYTLLMLDVIQQFFIFIIFVWRKKIGQLLLKQFGC